MKNSIDVSKILYRKLNTGNKMPCLGMGTFGSDKYNEDQVAKAVEGAIKSGYRLFDCASVYGNEKMIGNVFKDAILSGIVKREELFIISKVWNDMHGDGDVIKSCEKSLKDLNLDYLDGFLVHWPFQNYHAPGCDQDSRNPESKPFSLERYMVAWRQMEKLYDMGFVNNIGMSNMTIPKLEAILPLCRIKPSLVEMELHPCFQQQELYDYCIQKDIQPIGYCPIGSPSRPERDKTSNDISDMDNLKIVEIAKRHNVHPATVCIKWAVQRGQIPIPFSVKEEQYLSNLKCMTEDPLTDEEMDEIKKIDADCRLIKGQVFLWEGAKDWQDLWDLNGKITI